MKSILSATFSLILSVTVFFAKAQTLPQFPALQAKEDYTKAEPLFQQVTVWLNETDIDKQEDLRKRANAFILQWVMGSPTVNVGMGNNLVDLFNKNPQLLPIYIANNASFCISNKENKDVLEAAKAGLLAVVKVYRKGTGIKKTKALDKLVTAADEDKLDDYIAKNLKKELGA